ncbi:pseudaminic acid cytidylyltransferase [Bordetella genomosp. 13]|uniref:pseudaminic acid cytidylyltransferase n=1 Tax=Bordetella genomosp. 13 TaxID=463040 RepID=UPI0011A011F1|nr:pseudaminic acid cytidylyltransferase [Bordetella genomosp. 13]
MKLAVIPARGGSKRIPRKNLRGFCGKPMLAWPLEAALQSGCFDEIVVSTDDPEIAAVAREAGAKVPFMRPAELSDDHTGTTAVIQHAIQWHVDHGVAPQQVCCIYATAPFVRAEDLRQGLASLQETGAQYAFSVTTYAFPVQRALRLEGARIAMLHPENFSLRSQDLEEVFHDAGQFYWGTAQAWLAGAPVFGGDAVPVQLPRYRVQDIDTPEDWIQAELLFKTMAQRGGG